MLEELKGMIPQNERRIMDTVPNTKVFNMPKVWNLMDKAELSSALSFVTK